MDNLIEILNSKAVAIILGFILTSILGKLIANWIQNKNWRVQTKTNLFKSRYEEGKEFLDELSLHMGKRYFLLQRLFWAIRDSNDEEIDPRRKEYFDSVVDWNSKIWYYRNKIRLLVGNQEADLFLDFLENGVNPKTIHHKFVYTHQKVIDSIDDKEYGKAQSAIYELNYGITSYLESLTSKFQVKSNNLELLNIIESK